MFESGFHYASVYDASIIRVHSESDVAAEFKKTTDMEIVWKAKQIFYDKNHKTWQNENADVRM